MKSQSAHKKLRDIDETGETVATTTTSTTTTTSSTTMATTTTTNSTDVAEQLDDIPIGELSNSSNVDQTIKLH